MKKQQFIDTAKKIATDIPTRYQLGGWGQQDNGVYLFDCVCLIKSILWGFNFEKGGHGGAVYCSNGVPDVGANKMFGDYCYDKSTDFNKIEIGELVWLDGHIGIYIGNRLVAEATSAWDNKVLLSDIGKNGERIFNGKQVYRWTHHGKCNFIDYSDPEPTYKYNVGDYVLVNGYGHTTNEYNSGDTGYFENQIGKIIEIKDGEYPYHIEDMGWFREKYLEPYDDYKVLYEQEVLKNKDLQNQVNNLQGKIDKAIEDLK